MNVSVGGPKSEIEAEAKRKLINEKEIKAILASTVTRVELNRAKTKLNELLGFYDRIIKSVHATIKTVNNKDQLSHKQKNDLYIKNQEKELAQAKREKSRFRKYLRDINDKLAEAN